jgi:hypothetical protein
MTYRSKHKRTDHPEIKLARCLRCGATMLTLREVRHDRIAGARGGESAAQCDETTLASICEVCARYHSDQ